MYRSILAVDIEGSTKRTNPVMEELREEVYRLVVEALYVAGIASQHHDPFTDRGDGVLVLLRPADEFPKPLLLSPLIPILASLLVAHNSGISPADQPRILRLRTVIHAGEVHYDENGPFGEDLDVAFRLLNAPRFKTHLKNATVPLALVASDYIYQTIIRHGYDGIAEEEFLPLVTRDGRFAAAERLGSASPRGRNPGGHTDAVRGLRLMSRGARGLAGPGRGLALAPRDPLQASQVEIVIRR